jgi:NADH-quinone oxidoreductase subunit L
VSLTFHGEARWPHDRHPHDAPAAMRYPLIVLALLSIVGGFAGVPHVLGGGNAIEAWLRPVFEKAQTLLPPAEEASAPVEYALMALSVGIAAAGIWFARFLYLKRGDVLAAIVKKAGAAQTILLKKYYVDEVYDAAVVTPAVQLSDRVLWKFFDVGVVDGLVNGTARLVGFFSGQLRKVQAGVAQTYALAFVAGVLLLLGILFMR